MGVGGLHKVKQTRRKPIKSCTFCRKRKLRCDQKKPICSACAQRNLTNCTYTSSALIESSSSRKKATDKVTTRDDLNRMIAILEDQLKKAQSQTEKTINPLREMYSFQTKKNGRVTWYGPTAVLSLVRKTHWGTSDSFRNLWAKVKSTRKQFKQQRGTSLLSENCLVEEPVGDPHAFQLPLSIVQDTCAVLPSYEATRGLLISFFENKQLFEVDDILDKEKVLKDFEDGFVPGPLLPLSSERSIVNLLPSEKKNYYKVGVVIAVLAVGHYRDDVPQAIRRFLVFLAGLCTGKVMYIERLQMNLLRHFYRVTFWASEDAAHTMILGHSLTQEAMRMGLNHNIREFFKGQEKNVGRLETIENLWSRITFADFDTSLLSGSPMQIHPDLIYDESFFSDHSKTSQGLLKRYLSLVRPMQHAITSKYGRPPLDSFCEMILDFIEAEFPPIWHFTEAESVHKTSTMEKRIMSHLFSYLMILLGLRFTAYGEKTHELKNAVLVTSLMALAFSINLITCAYEQDKKMFPSYLSETSEGLSPYLYQAVSMTTKLLSRVLPIFYGMAYHKLTLFENGLLIELQQGESACDLRTLRTPPGVRISLMNSFEMFQSMFDQLLSREEIKTVIFRSRIIRVFFTMEKVGRVIINKVLKYRTSAENSWVSQSQIDNITDGSMARPVTSQTASGDFSSAVSPVIQGIQPNGEDNSPTRSKASTSKDGSTDHVDPDMAMAISDEFWSTYNLGWEEYMNNAEYNQLFMDFK